MSKITGTTKAWMTEYTNLTPDELATPKGVTSLTFSNNDMKSAGWTYIGEATITVDVPSREALIDGKVEALRTEASNIRAEATAKVTRIEGLINQLLCIEMSPAQASAVAGAGDIPF